MKMEQKEKRNDREELPAWPRKHGVAEYIFIMITLIILLVIFWEQVIWVLHQAFRMISIG